MERGSRVKMQAALVSDCDTIPWINMPMTHRAGVANAKAAAISGTTRIQRISGARVKARVRAKASVRTRMSAGTRVRFRSRRLRRRNSHCGSASKDGTATRLGRSCSLGEERRGDREVMLEVCCPVFFLSISLFGFFFLLEVEEDTLICYFLCVLMVSRSLMETR